MFGLLVMCDYLNEQTLEILESTPGLTWTPGIPERFAGMTQAEIRAMLMPLTRYANAQKLEIYGDAPETFDWKEKKPECLKVRDQASCGSCWAFSAVGPFSDSRCISGVDATRVQYSEQYMVSCDKANLGCNGGYLNKDMQFLKKTGVSTNACNSYKSGNGVTGKCPTTCDDKSPIVLYKSKDFADVSANEESIKNAVTQGTLQTGFTVYSDFMYYTGGIYKHTTGYVEGGHAVTIVGFGIEDGVKFWQVRNSWGEGWGEEGYFRIVRGINHCDFEEEVYMVKV